MGPLSADIMMKAFTRLDELVACPVTLIVGGGGAMVLAHSFPLSTADVDAIPKGLTIAELDPHVKQIAKEQGLPGDWLNPYFQTFAYTLPSDYLDRTICVFSGVHLKVLALGREDLLLMKCFAHRAKDVAHARALIKQGAKLSIVELQIEMLQKKGLPGCDEAFEFLDELVD